MISSSSNIGGGAIVVADVDMELPRLLQPKKKTSTSNLDIQQFGVIFGRNPTTSNQFNCIQFYRSHTRLIRRNASKFQKCIHRAKVVNDSKHECYVNVKGNRLKKPAHTRRLLCCIFSNATVRNSYPNGAVSKCRNK